MNAKLWISAFVDFTKKTISAINNHNALIVAIATIALVVVTYCHMDEAKNMRETTEKMVTETKRLADISVEQFKIKSYPTILITNKEYSLESDEIIQKFGFTNKGEMSAFNLSILIINTYKKNKKIKSKALRFKEKLNAHYIIADDKITSLDFETKLPPATKYLITQVDPIIPPFRVDHPIHALLIIRFKVPYDTYRYETYSYILEEEKKWQRMNDDDTYDLLERYFKIADNEKALKFLSYNEHFFNYQTRDIWKR